MAMPVKSRKQPYDQALTTPLARLPVMAVGQPYLWAEVARQTWILKIRATNLFLRQTVAHSTPYTLLILRGNLRGNCQIQ